MAPQICGHRSSYEILNSDFATTAPCTEVLCTAIDLSAVTHQLRSNHSSPSHGLSDTSLHLADLFRRFHSASVSRSRPVTRFARSRRTHLNVPRSAWVSKSSRFSQIVHYRHGIARSATDQTLVSSPGPVAQIAGSRVVCPHSPRSAWVSKSSWFGRVNNDRHGIVLDRHGIARSPV